MLYPLQTFSRAKAIDFSAIPLYIEAGEGETLSQLTQLAESLSHEVHVATSAQRAILHVAAVFACNFSNPSGRPRPRQHPHQPRPTAEGYSSPVLT